MELNRVRTFCMHLQAYQPAVFGENESTDLRAELMFHRINR